MRPSPRNVVEFIDQPGEIPQPPVWRRWWFIVATALLVPVVLIVVAALSVVAWLGVRHRTAIRDVQEEVARIRASCEPVSTEDLHAFHQVPAGVRDITSL